MFIKFLLLFLISFDCYAKPFVTDSLVIRGEVADKVLYIDANKEVQSSGTNYVKLQYIDNVTGDIQALLNGKLNLSSAAAVGLSGQYSDLSGNPTLLSQFTNDTNFTNQTALDLKVNKLSSGFFVTALNKSSVYQAKDGLVINQLDSATQTNTAGAFNGGGTGQKAFIEFDAYNNLPLSSLTTLKFTAKSHRDSSASISGQVAWNILANFNNGFLTAANDYFILVEDSLPAEFVFYHILTSSFAEYSVDFSARSFKAVGGTGVISFTGNVGPVGSNQVTNVSGTNINALTVGQYIRKLPTGSLASAETNMTFPDGTTITAINVTGNSFTVSQPSGVSLAAISLKQYGGVAPDTRAATCNGTTTISLGGRSSDSVVTTADLQVNFLASGAGISANSYIVSMVANTSITLNAACTTGSPTLSFIAKGKTGIPGNAEAVGVPLSVIIGNNPSAYITNNAPMTPIWTAADGGAPKNVTKMGGIQFVQGSSSMTSHRANVLQNVTINSDFYNFAQ